MNVMMKSESLLSYIDVRFQQVQNDTLALSMYTTWPSFWVWSAKQTLGVARSQLCLIT